MKITKLGHCCLLIEEKSARLLFDPGNLSTIPDLKNLDAILITHEHADHCEIPVIKKIIEQNPSVKIYTNAGVGKKLVAENISFELLENGGKAEIKNVVIEGFGFKHESILPSISPVVNVGYLVAGRLFHPGDSYDLPDKAVEVLALPVCAPWLRVSEAVAFATKVKPQIVFPIHDGHLKVVGPFYRMSEMGLTEANIKWLVIPDGESMEL